MRTNPGADADATTDHAAEPADPGARPYVYAMGFIGVLFALIVAVPAWLFAAERTCGCTQPPDIVVYNLDSRPVAITWRQAGAFGTPLLGRSESVRVEACSTSGSTLPAGRVHLVIDSSTAAGEFDLDVPRTFADGPIGWFAVRAGGAVDRLQGSLPERNDPESSCGA